MVIEANSFIKRINKKYSLASLSSIVKELRAKAKELEGELGKVSFWNRNERVELGAKVDHARILALRTERDLRIARDPKKFFEERCKAIDGARLADTKK